MFNIKVIAVKELKDGSAEVVLELSKEALSFIVGEFVKEALVNYIKNEANK